MDNNMLAELDEVVRLSERATPGEWLVATHGLPEDHWRVADCGGSKSSLPNPLVVAEIGDYCKPAEDDAAYIAALSNYFRTHHATLADMAKRLEAAERDAARFAPCLWVQDADDGSWDTACGNKHMFIDGDAADNLYQHCPYCGGHLIEPNYAAIDATQEGEG